MDAAVGPSIDLERAPAGMDGHLPDFARLNAVITAAPVSVPTVVEPFGVTRWRAALGSEKRRKRGAEHGREHDEAGWTAHANLRWMGVSLRQPKRAER
jgi:hypothetical protein